MAHTYVTKPGIFVTKEGKGHLTCRNGDVRIDAVTFASDLMKSYRKHVRPRLKNASQREAMQARLNEMLRAYTDDSGHFTGKIAMLPKTFYSTGTSASSASVPRFP